MEKVESRLTLRRCARACEGAAGSFPYCGRQIEDHGKYIAITTPEKLKKVKPIHFGEGRI